MEDSKETTGGDLDVATLMGLLKDKAKELKSTQKKLNKVEDKYVEIRREHKGLLSDRENFIQFLHIVF